MAEALIGATAAMAQNGVLDATTQRRLDSYFLNYKLPSHSGYLQARLADYHIDTKAHTVTLMANDAFAAQDFTPETVQKIYKKISRLLPAVYRDYKLRIAVNGTTIDLLATAPDYDQGGATRMWGRIDYKGQPWVRNASRPYPISRGLYNRHLTVYASHGRYYDQRKGAWKWQRPSLFATTEDLFTPTLVVPYLIPMLEKAGANVFTPRERDWQPHEVVVDNDTTPPGSRYEEITQGGRQWQTTAERGFAARHTILTDGDNPFCAGTARMARTTKSKNKISLAVYTPNIPEAGRYAVYVSYQTQRNSVDDAEYIVCHGGQETRFRVNQQMGGGTWVYLGTFYFDQGYSEANRVVVTNQASHRGIVTTDAVRFGGGMGNIQRGGMGSGMPRAMEAARYTAQWSGAPYSVYSSKGGLDDYSDDINTRPLMTNWLAGGSVYMPTMTGKMVPIELSLAVHSDAGFTYNGKDLTGSLAICTTHFNDGLLSAGIPRTASKTLAQSLLDGIAADLRAKYKTWAIRYLWDRNYSETRNPEIPSAIIETLSHQNFADMTYAQDPNFKFTMARALYKSILKYVAAQHGTRYTVQPLPPRRFSLKMVAPGRVQLAWQPQTDPREPTAMPTSYIIYTAKDRQDFDNGTVATSPSYTIDIEPGRQYNFKVAAVNAGGESFATETLSAWYSPKATKTVLVVNGFDRLSAPAVIDTPERQGFDLDADMGVSYGLTEWNGRQTDFNRSRIGVEGPGGLGYGGEDMAGQFVAGNDFSYVVSHTEAIASSGRYNVVSCGKDAVSQGLVSLADYPCVDLILGLERFTPYSLEYYKTFTPQWQQLLRSYTQQGGNLLVSGSYIGSDMQDDRERQFLADVLQVGYQPADSVSAEAAIHGLGVDFSIQRQPNRYHYAVQHPEILHPKAPAYCAMQYANGTSAAVAYQGTAYRSFAMGFPFECITSGTTRNALMQGILTFLLPQ